MNRHLFWNDWAFNYNFGSWNYPYWGRWNRLYAYNFNYRPYYDQFRIYNMIDELETYLTVPHQEVPILELINQEEQ